MLSEAETLTFWPWIISHGSHVMPSARGRHRGGAMGAYSCDGRSDGARSAVEQAHSHPYQLHPLSLPIKICTMKASFVAPIQNVDMFSVLCHLVTRRGDAEGSATGWP